MSSVSRKRRNGQAQACEPCRKAKIRCDHETPSCGRCVRRDLSCTYHPAPMTRARGSIKRLDGFPPSPIKSPIEGFRSPSSQSPNLPSLTPTPTPTPTEIPPKGLFLKPPTSYGTTRFSAVFSENQASFAPAMVDFNEEDEHGKEHSTDSSRYEEAATTARKELAITTLMNFPTARTCEIILRGIPFMVDIWTSPTMSRHCLTQIWSEYGVHLGERRCRASVSQMANDLFENSKPSIRANENTRWFNWFGGCRLRWEMIGIIFTFAGFAFMHLQEWDPVFNLPEQEGRNRKTAADKMRACAESCLQLCQETETTDLTVILMKNIWKLQSNIISDESDKIRIGSGMVASAFITVGLHRITPIPIEEITPSAQYRTAVSASLYYLDKCESLFTGRPPLFDHHYCTYQLPLDLSEEETFGDPEIFAAAKAKLDSNGWNTNGKIYTTTYLRALCLQTPIKEEILRLSLGINTQFSKEQIDNLNTHLNKIVSSYPPHIQYPNINTTHANPNSTTTTAQQTFPRLPARELYLTTRIHLDVLQCRFLIQRLAVSRNYTTSQQLFNIAYETMTVVLSLWLNRDQLYNWNFAFDWIVVCYGIPSAGVLSLELLNSMGGGGNGNANASGNASGNAGGGGIGIGIGKGNGGASAENLGGGAGAGAGAGPKQQQQVIFSRSNVIQSLTMFIAFLAWIRPTDGNRELCWRLKRVVKRIVDSVLDSPVYCSSTSSSSCFSSFPNTSLSGGGGGGGESVDSHQGNNDGLSNVVGAGIGAGDEGLGHSGNGGSGGDEGQHVEGLGLLQQQQQQQQQNGGNSSSLETGIVAGTGTIRFNDHDHDHDHGHDHDHNSLGEAAAAAFDGSGNGNGNANANASGIGHGNGNGTMGISYAGFEDGFLGALQADDLSWLNTIDWTRGEWLADFS